MPALICGSLAFDTITTFPGRFSEQILPDQVHILNVSFLVPTLRREFGGCAGNIAFNLAGLGGHAVPLAATGPDAQDYMAHLAAHGVETSHLRAEPDSHTAQAIIITDADNNQITAFHPGAMQLAHRLDIPDRADLAIAIVAPDGRDAMLEHARQLAERGIPFIFDPGQGLPMFNGEELAAFVARARWVAVNDYEGRMLCDRMGTDLAALSRRPGLAGLIVTLGAEGCEVWVDGQCERVAPVPVDTPVDPTGCGDAFRAALLYGLERGWTLARCARLGNRLGALKIASRGGQNHSIDRAALLSQA